MWDNTCRCCDTAMDGSDHCPECGCEEFEEQCEVKMATVTAWMRGWAEDEAAAGDVEDAAGAARCVRQFVEWQRDRG